MLFFHSSRMTALTRCCSAILNSRLAPSALHLNPPSNFTSLGPGAPTAPTARHLLPHFLQLLFNSSRACLHCICRVVCLYYSSVHFSNTTMYFCTSVSKTKPPACTFLGFVFFPFAGKPAPTHHNKTKHQSLASKIYSFFICHSCENSSVPISFQKHHLLCCQSLSLGNYSFLFSNDAIKFESQTSFLSLLAHRKCTVTESL